MEPLVRLGSHVAATLIVTLPLLWITWRHRQGVFRSGLVAARLTLYAVVSWFVAFGIEATLRQVLPPTENFGGVTRKRQVSWRDIEATARPRPPFPEKGGKGGVER